MTIFHSYVSQLVITRGYLKVIMDLDLDDKASTLISASFDGFVKAAAPLFRGEKTWGDGHGHGLITQKHGGVHG